jgi:hypothetical protein
MRHGEGQAVAGLGTDHAAGRDRAEDQRVVVMQLVTLARVVQVDIRVDRAVGRRVVDVRVLRVLRVAVLAVGHGATSGLRA